MTSLRYQIFALQTTSFSKWYGNHPSKRLGEQWLWGASHRQWQCKESLFPWVLVIMLGLGKVLWHIWSLVLSKRNWGKCGVEACKHSDRTVEHKQWGDGDIRMIFFVQNWCSRLCKAINSSVWRGNHANKWQGEQWVCSAWLLLIASGNARNLYSYLLGRSLAGGLGTVVLHVLKCCFFKEIL